MKNPQELEERKLWELYSTKRIRDLKWFKYLTAFRFKYEEALKKDYSIQITLIPFEGGSIIENKVVDKDLAQTTKLEKIYTIEEAFKYANLEMLNNENEKINSVKGTSIIINKDICYLIKDNTNNEWKPEKAKKDIELILQDLLPCLPPVTSNIHFKV